MSELRIFVFFLFFILSIYLLHLLNLHVSFNYFTDLWINDFFIVVFFFFIFCVVYIFGVLFSRHFPENPNWYDSTAMSYWNRVYKNQWAYNFRRKSEKEKTVDEQRFWKQLIYYIKKMGRKQCLMQRKFVQRMFWLFHYSVKRFTLK